MRKRRHRTPNEILTSQSQPVPLPVAASLVYHHLNRDVGNAAPGHGYGAAICSTALALSQVSDIYHVEAGKLLRIPSEDLAAGVFEDRGDTYRAASGKTYRSLSMRRVDVMEAMTVLRRAQAAIDGARVKAKHHG